MENRFGDIGAAITNSGEGIDLDLMDESRKRTYRVWIKLLTESHPTIILQISSIIIISPQVLFSMHIVRTKGTEY